jgi:hypothetical protein
MSLVRVHNFSISLDDGRRSFDGRGEAPVPTAALGARRATKTTCQASPRGRHDGGHAASRGSHLCHGQV